jgi:hypothetical protein
MPRGVIIVANETWKLSAVTNRRTRRKLAKELDRLEAYDGGDMGILKDRVRQFGDLLLDADIRYAEVL